MIKQIEKSLRLVLDPATNKLLGQGVFINDCFVFPLHIQNVKISQVIEVILYAENDSIEIKLNTTKIFVINVLKELDLVISRIIDLNISREQLCITDINSLNNKLLNNSICSVFSLTFNEENIVYCVKSDVIFHYKFQDNSSPIILNKYKGWMLKGYSGSPIFLNNSDVLVGFVLGNLANEPNSFVSINMTNKISFFNAVKIKIDNSS